MLLNHIYFVISGSIFSDLRQNEFLTNHFANVENKTISAEGFGSWSGLYVRGENTYIELLEKFDNHDIGIGLGVETEAELVSLAQRAQYKYPDIKLGEFKMLEDPLPLFKYCQFADFIDKHTGKTISIFLIAYTKDTFEIRESLSDFPENDVSRKRYNSKTWNADRYFRDITEIHLTVGHNSVEYCRDVFELLELKQVSPQDKRGICYQGKDFSITVSYEAETQTTSCMLKGSLTKPIQGKETIAFLGGELYLEDRATTFNISCA